jgi:ATP-binding cassette subfamily C protein LapB
MKDDSVFSCIKYLIAQENKQFLKFVEQYLKKIRFHETDKSVDALVETFDHFGIKIGVKKTRLRKIKSSSQAVIALMKDGGACVISSEVAGFVKVHYPKNKNEATQVERAQFKENYAGVILDIEFPDESVWNEGGAIKEERGFSWFWNIIFNYREFYVHILLTAFFINLFALSIPLFAMNVYDRIIPNRTADSLWALAIGIIMIICFDFLLKILRGYFVDQVGKKIDLRMSSKLLDKSLNLKMVDHKSAAGIRVSQLKDFDSIRDFLSSVTLVGIIDLPFMVIAFLVMYVIGGPLVFVPMVVVVLSLLSAYLISKPLNKYIDMSLQSGAAKNALLYESLSNVEAIKHCCAQNIILNKWKKLSIKSYDSITKSKFYSNFALNITTSLGLLTNIFVVIAGSYLVWKGELTVGSIIACSILSGKLVAPIIQICSILTRYHQAKCSLGSLNELMNKQCEGKGFRRFYHINNLKGAIEFKDVSFHYDTQGTSFIDKMSFKIKAGEKIAILGNSGSGKSTIFKLITGLYEAEDGIISMDGMNLHQIDPFVLRSNLGYTEQDVQIFSGTLWENVIFKNQNCEEKAALQAMKLSGVDSFALKHPDGYNLELKERGRGLSSGQLQSIVIARAILLDPDILLFDEPTSSMDHGLERNFIKNMKSYSKNKTLIISTHKHSLLELVDRIIIVDNGKIVADGPKDEVFKKMKSA